MSETFLLSIAATGFVVAFAHAAIPTHWLPFVLAGRGQRWSRAKTLAVVALCGAGHVLFTTLLGALVVWLGIETSEWTGNVFPYIVGGALVLFGLYYLLRQARGSGHGHHHFGLGRSHGTDGRDPHGHKHHHSGGDHGRHRQGTHDHGHRRHGGHNHHHPHEAHEHGLGTRRIDTGHAALALEIFEDGVPPRFRVRAEGDSPLPQAATLTVETVRRGGARQAFSFAERDGYLESVEEIAEPHEFTATVSLSHGDHAHRHEVRFEEHRHVASARREPASGEPLRADSGKSDGAVILGLFTLLTFSPCEGFLPVYLSGISYGWIGFIALSAVLAIATIAGMVAFVWLTMSGIERLRLAFLERYESGMLGAVFVFLGVGVVFFGF